MWGTFLSEPLRIVGLVGRYPANCLMRRMPIPGRNRFLWLRRDVSPQRYAVLVRISPGYPPARGRLHTCYSPVRRSPAEKSKLSSPLPLDLHVLSLSLAFILSQDQTLRCCLSCLFSFSCKKAKNQDSLSLLFAFTAPRALSFEASLRVAPAFCQTACLCPFRSG